MSRAIMFSQSFPSYHPRGGQPTLFVEKLWRFMDLNQHAITDRDNALANRVILKSTADVDVETLAPKLHTIRKGNRWRENQCMSPRIWEGAPYRSKQIPIGPDLLVRRVWTIQILPSGEVYIQGQIYGFYGSPEINRLAVNDGLSQEDFQNWFTHLPFEGQIICWDAALEY